MDELFSKASSENWNWIVSYYLDEPITIIGEVYDKNNLATQADLKKALSYADKLEKMTFKAFKENTDEKMKYVKRNGYLRSAFLKTETERRLGKFEEALKTLSKIDVADIKDTAFNNDLEKLKEKVDAIKSEYDFIIIDCPPSLSLLTINALTAADSVLIPIQCEYYDLEGLGQMVKTINLIRKRLNKKLTVEGVVFTMYDARTNLSQQVVESVKETLDEYIYNAIIPRNVRLAEAPSYGQPITEYDTRSSGAESYRMLAAEVISRN